MNRINKTALMAICFLTLAVMSCSKDDSFESASDTSLNPRSSVSMAVSYDLVKVSKIDPEQGGFEDMCLGDIRMLQELTRLYSISSTITETGDPCIEVVKKKKTQFQGVATHQWGGDNPGNSSISDGFEHESISKYCNNILTYITRDTTITKSATVNYGFWKQVIQGYLYTELEVKSHFDTMIQTQQQNGAVVEDDGIIVSVTETSPTGEQITSVYNKNTNLLMYTELKDENGNTKKTLAYEYTCSPDGKMVPKTILIKTNDTSTICKTPYIKKEWLMFKNYNVSI